MQHAGKAWDCCASCYADICRECVHQSCACVQVPGLSPPGVFHIYLLTRQQMAVMSLCTLWIPQDSVILKVLRLDKSTVLIATTDRITAHVMHSLRITGADDEHLDNILEAAGKLPQISAIILLANGSQVRKTMSIKNVFSLLRGHLPDAVLENTLAVLTNCSASTR